MKNIIIATKNKGKVEEIKSLLAGCSFRVLSLKDVGIDIDIEETGSTFEENSLIKARAIQRLSGEIVIADDSVLEIDYLGGAPGIYSARFLGEISDEKRCQGVLSLMNGVPDEFRNARFRCAASIVKDKKEMTFFGVLEGKISFSAKGNNGFGYDPIFYVPQYKKTLAQLDESIKNSISHRGKAFELVAKELINWSSNETIFSN